MNLGDLVKGLEGLAIEGDPAAEVTGIQHDSRSVCPGDIFVVLRGENSDGSDYVAAALEAGAVGVLHHRRESGLSALAVPRLLSEDPRAVMGLLADRIYGSPSSRLKLAGVTGTNGKTTTAFLVHHLLQCAWRRAGLIGTVEFNDGVEAVPTTHTTPESTDLHRMLAQMQGNACRGAVLEVSSHALEQDRVAGVRFDVGIFTNLTPEHLDYHGSMERYFASKRRLFTQMAARGSGVTMVVNLDDPWGRRLVEEFAGGPARVVTYGMGARAEVRATSPKYRLTGTEFGLEAAGRKFLVRVPLVGAFNVYNVLAAIAAARAIGLNVRETVRNIASAPQVPGRLELVSDRSPFQVFVDYAHTADALDNVLRTVASLGKGRLITVFGCGGDRDASKRAPMATAAEKHSDFCIVTSDNPRSEPPKRIFDDIVRGFSGSAHMLVEDRREAIREAFRLARPGDAVVIAGKGHEDYQILGDRRIEFEDRREATFLLRDMGLARTVHETGDEGGEREASGSGSHGGTEGSSGRRERRSRADGPGCGDGGRGGR